MRGMNAGSRLLLAIAGCFEKLKNTIIDLILK
jgi:hypothetical protein